jgi:hypothetical protein
MGARHSYHQLVIGLNVRGDNSSLDAALDLQTASHCLVVLCALTTSLNVRFDFHTCPTPFQNIDVERRRRVLGSEVDRRSPLKAGGMTNQHNQTVASGLKVKSGIEADRITGNQNQKVVRGLKVKTGVKAGENNGDLRVGH